MSLYLLQPLYLILWVEGDPVMLPLKSYINANITHNQFFKL